MLGYVHAVNATKNKGSGDSPDGWGHVAPQTPSFYQPFTVNGFCSQEDSPMVENISLSAFCRDYSLSKGSVHKFLKAEGFDTSQGLTPDAVAAAKAYFLVNPTEPTDATETLGTTGGLTVLTGNHCTAIETPSYAGLTIDLGQFRDSEALVIDDPLDVAIQFLQTADQVQCALQADIKAREARLAQTRQAQDAIAAKAQELQLEQSNYRLQTARLDQAQSKETQALAANLEALQRLGKPNATASPQP